MHTILVLYLKAMCTFVFSITALILIFPDSLYETNAYVSILILIV